MIDDIAVIPGIGFDIDISISTDRLFCDPVRTNALTTTYFMEISEIEWLIYYYDPTPEQKQMYIDQRNSVGGLTFAYKVQTSKKIQCDSGGIYDDAAFSAPSAIIKESISLFTNEGTELVHPSPSYEVDFTGNQQGVKSCLCSFLPKIQSVYDEFEGNRFPGVNGLEHLTSAGVKKFQEHFSNHID